MEFTLVNTSCKAKPIQQQYTINGQQQANYITMTAACFHQLNMTPEYNTVVAIGDFGKWDNLTAYFIQWFD